jgi:hypothetical protein
MQKIFLPLILFLGCLPLSAIAQQSGCQNLPEYRQFDFWVGEWNVEANGKQAGTSSVQLILDGCVLFENWTGAKGSNGKSFNIYDSTTKKWQQFWVDNSGGSILFTGEFENGKLTYHSKNLQPDGSTVLGRMTFNSLPGKKVHQMWEQSTDQGKTWKVAFDGIYTPKDRTVTP